MSSPSAVLPLILLATSSLPFALATKNFCGSSWGDASTGCINNQPCPMGTDDECTSGGQCWADTECDTNLGHGINYNTFHPSHSRFCGKTWNDANENCSLKRHCPSGDSSECPGSEECYSFLGDCNYVEMMGGPEAAAAAAGGGGGDGEGNDRLSSQDPSRHNFCGWDWNDALAHCNDDDHWCPSGSDSDCPGGKVCYAGTDCFYDSDLGPTKTPTDRPTEQPSPAPIIYNRVENTRFCGTGWEDALATCRIASACPSGENSDCYGDQVCFSYLIGCNILDFQDHLKEHGQEIFGADHWLLPDDPESEEVKNMPTVYVNPGPGQAAPSDVKIPPSEPPPPQPPPTPRPTNSPVKFDPNAFNAQNHVFCGKSWNDAMTRCSPETYCKNGAQHKCDDASDFCWSGVDACSAAEWVPTASPSGKPTEPHPTPLPTDEPTEEVITTTSTVSSYQFVTPTPSTTPQEGVVTSSIRQSFCAVDYKQLVQSCSVLPTCNGSAKCEDGLMCFSNYKCSTVHTSPPTSLPTRQPSPLPTRPPTPEPTTYSPTPMPTAYSLSEAEVAQRLVNMNSYCGTSLAQIMSRCAEAEDPLYTCNIGDPPCGRDSYCFENLICPDPFAVRDEPKGQDYCAPHERELDLVCDVDEKARITCNSGDGPCPIGMTCFRDHICPLPTPPPTQRPTMLNAKTPTVSKPVVVSVATTIMPTSKPSSSNNHLDDASSGQNYCAQNEELVISSCAWAPTCNDSPSECPKDTFCYSNVVCPDRTEQPLPTQTDEDVVEVEPDPVQETLKDETFCDGLCLQPVVASDCDYISTIKIEILPCALVGGMADGWVEVGSLCSGNGACGTDVNLNNCGPTDGQDIYVRLPSAKCVDHGFSSGSGVVPPSTHDAKGNVAIDAADTEVVLDSSDVSNHSNNTIEREGSETKTPEVPESDPSWDDWSPPKETDGEEPDLSGWDNELTGWWLRGNLDSAATVCFAIRWVAAVGFLLQCLLWR